MKKNYQRYRLLIDRLEHLKRLAEPILFPYKPDWQAFPTENLVERYRSKSKRLKRIQKLYLQVQLEITEIIDHKLNS